MFNFERGDKYSRTDTYYCGFTIKILPVTTGDTRERRARTLVCLPGISAQSKTASAFGRGSIDLMRALANRFQAMVVLPGPLPVSLNRKRLATSPRYPGSLHSGDACLPKATDKVIAAIE